MHMMQGTPYIYQGEEFGMTNPGYVKISDYRDVESLNTYRLKMEDGMSEEAILEILRHKSRDNSRTPVQWNDEKHAGFTTGTPWIGVAENYSKINAEQAVSDKGSIFYHYKKLIRLRKDYDIVTHGDFQLILEKHPEIFAYIRNGKDEKLLVISNYYAKETVFTLPDDVDAEGYKAEILLSNYEDSSEKFGEVTLRPYESIIYHLKK
jgi:trehalose-6-phosphate hydrolase